MNINQIKVSVCLITYNQAPYIRQALDSVLMQKTDFPFEILIGEDESNDGTREICQEYARKYPDIIRLFLRRRKDVIEINGKPSGRFNFLETIKEAKGKYIAFLDGDDYWTHPEKLQMQHDLMENHPDCSLCFGQVEYILAENGEEITQAHIKFEPNLILTDNDWLKHMPGVSSSLMWRTKCIKNIPDWTKSTMFGDLTLCIVVLQFGRAYYIDEKLSVYRRHRNGIWSNLKPIEKNNQVVKCLEEFLEVYPEKYNKEINLLIYRKMILNTQIAKDSKEHKNFWLSLGKAFKHWRIHFPWKIQSYLFLAFLGYFLNFIPFARKTIKYLRGKN